MEFEADIHKTVWGEEEWLVSAHRSAPSRIAGGGGQTLRDLAPDFPILVKRIRADRRLSVQVHPNDVTAKVVGGEAKTEMWCVLKDGPLFAGFRPGVTAADVERAVADGSFEDLLKRFDAKRGECYFIPGGLVHAIGDGTSVFEVQQSSDTTFRLYDWGRVGVDGKPRKLHVKEALAAMDLALPPPVPSDAVSCAYFDFRKAAAGTTVSAARGWTVAYVPSDNTCRLLAAGESFVCQDETFVAAVR